MMNIKETIKSVDWKSAGIGACVVLATEVAVYGTVKGVKAASKFIKGAIKKAEQAKNDGLDELDLNDKKENK